jgi:N-acetylmuramoyl-L-alanine amidase
VQSAPSPNFWPGRVHGEPIAVVIHTMAGTMAGCTAWFQNPASQVSAHFGVDLRGEMVRYVRRDDTAWANGLLEPGNRWPGPAINPNWLTVSIETEDLGNPDQAVPWEQYRSVRTLVRTMRAAFPTVKYVMGHEAITPRSRPNCPGKRWIASGRLEQLARDCGLILV